MASRSGTGILPVQLRLKHAQIFLRAGSETRQAGRLSHGAPPFQLRNSGQSCLPVWENLRTFTTMNAESLQKLERLEALVAHLERQVEQLNEVVTDQSKLVEFLKKQMQRQSSVLETMELETIKANNARPPHH
jgi:uncharacterized coiled-coil protein SlyX